MKNMSLSILVFSHLQVLQLELVLLQLQLLFSLGAMLGMGSAALAGAVIAPIAVIAGCLVTVCVIEPIAEKVNDYIISPIVERFSSKEEERDLPAK
ncbi:hypothetical protein [Wolbachia endosymbiont (group B) of Eucosma cana]|uniref:hypothetical protein n=1 Tax=Wolbachia endosymbiont (group B) of Eucosma cana TaxID=2954012 RepID=UPI002226E586|nr:hypothetical protein [Wolbachia endosymbiont (group B) of Eucosma cana]